MSAIMIGDMGIQEALLGEDSVYLRRSAYFYLALDTSQPDQEESDQTES